MFQMTITGYQWSWGSCGHRFWRCWLRHSHPEVKKRLPNGPGRARMHKRVLLVSAPLPQRPWLWECWIQRKAPQGWYSKFLYPDSPLSVNLVDKVAPKIKERMMREGSMMVTYQPLRHLPNFFRLVVQSSGVTHTDVDFFINEIARLGADLWRWMYPLY